MYMVNKIVSLRIDKCTIDMVRWGDIKLSNPLYFYIFAAFLDLEANFLVLSAYNYTSITSIMMLDCFTIPSAMLLSSYFLRAKYQTRHSIGVFICIMGLGCIIASDLRSGESGDNAVLGDLMCLLGAFLYACSNVLQEKVVKTQNREEYLGMIGLCGACLSSIQCLICDFDSMRRSEWSLEMWLCILGFVACLFCMYVNTSLFLQSGDSTLFNLSLLTSDVYAVIFSYFFTGELVHWLYFVGFALILVGLTLYHSTAKPVNVSTMCVVTSASFVPVSLSEGEGNSNYNPLTHSLNAAYHEETEYPHFKNSLSSNVSV